VTGWVVIHEQQYIGVFVIRVGSAELRVCNLDVAGQSIWHRIGPCAACNLVAALFPFFVSQ